MPSVGPIKPVKISTKVLLPDPDVPMIPILSPFSISIDTSFKISLSELGYLNETFLKERLLNSKFPFSSNLLSAFIIEIRWLSSFLKRSADGNTKINCPKA